MWYVLQVKSGAELNVRKSLAARGVLSYVPRENRTIRSGGKWTFKEYTLFPGYLFINMELDAKKYYTIKETPDIIRFLGPDGKPSTLTCLEAEYIRLLCGPDGEAIPPATVEYTDDGITVESGVLQYFTSKITEVNKHSRKVTIAVDICGEAKEITLSYNLESETKSDNPLEAQGD